MRAGSAAVKVFRGVFVTVHIGENESTMRAPSHKSRMARHNGRTALSMARASAQSSGVVILMIQANNENAGLEVICRTP